MKLFEILKEYGIRGQSVSANEFRFLYHICDHHSYAYAMETNSLRSRGSSAISTTWDDNLRHVVGKYHLDFKFVLDAPKLISTYGAYHYDDKGYVGSQLTSHNEREIRIETNNITPLSDYLLGTCLLFDLFSETGIQWLLYKHEKYGGGFLSDPTGFAHPAIDYIYHQKDNGIPVWSGTVGTEFTTDQWRFLDKVREIRKLNLPFTKSLEMVAEIQPIKDFWNKPTDADTYRRRHLAPVIVKLLNNYYVNRKIKNIKDDEVRELISQIIDILGVSSNFKIMAMNCIEEHGLFTSWTEPVQWGSIIKDIMNYDADELLDSCEYFGNEIARRKNAFGDDSRFTDGSHYGTSFGRLSRD